MDILEFQLDIDSNNAQLPTCYKSNSRRGSVDRNAGEMKILYFYRAMVEAATGFIAERCVSL
jgi:hypothetical protein